MGDFEKFKYSCRACPIRQECIDAKSLAPGMKMAIAHTFRNRTDTFETWQVLQQDCLLVRREKHQTAPLSPTVGLLRRLQEMQEPAEPQPVKPTPIAPRSRPRPAPSTAPREPTPEQVAYGLTVLANQRLIRLPDRGEVVLGRFDYGVGQPPDIDLTFDDGLIPSVSRRHALIISRRGEHWIEDMGSTNGTYLDGNRLALGKSEQLAPGSRLILGRCRLVYSPLPDWAFNPDPKRPHACFLRVTHTGDQIALPEQEAIMIGRSDPSLDFKPDIDLGDVGDIGRYVSRRHVRIISRQGRHFVEEAGSASGTRLNGRPIQVGTPPVLLQPGDQLSLGGCVVAYDWRLLEGA